MADLPDWLLALLGGQQNNPNAQGPSPSGGLLAGAMPPPMGGLLTAPRPVPVDATVDPAADPNTPIRIASNDLTQGRSVATGGTDVPDAAPTSGTNVIGTPASGTTEASSPGFFSKAGQVLGSLYGQGGPGDALISLGAGIASPEGWATGVQKSLAAQSGNALNNARLQAFKLQMAQQQAGQTATASYLKSKGATDAEITAAINGAAAGQGDLLKNLITRYSGNDKYSYQTRPDNSVVGINTADPTDVKPILPPQDPQPKPFIIGEDPTTGRKSYGIMKGTTIVPIDDKGNPIEAGPSPSPNTVPTLPPVDTTKPPQPGTPEAAAIKSRGEAFLQTLDPGFAAQVRAVAEGREPYPVGTRSAGALALMRAVNQYDPFFDKTSTDARQKTRLDFAAGGPNSTAGVISAGNTGIQHLGHLSDWAEELAKNNTSYPLWNKLKNDAAINVGGGLPAMNFDTVAGLVSEELTKFYRGAGGNEADINRLIDKLKSSGSPGQLRSTLNTITDLVGSKVNALQRQWHQGMGPLAEDYPILQPESQQVLGSIKQRVQNVPGGIPGGEQQQSPASPRAFPSWRIIGGAT